MHQASYAYSLLERFAEELHSKKTTSIPAPHETFSNSDSPPIPTETAPKDAKLKKRCQQILGAVLWLTTRTRPDISYAHSRAASFIERDVHACYQRSILILRYLQAFPSIGLKYAVLTVDPVVTLYGDCSFAPTGQASHEGHIAYIGPNAVTWRSKRQTLIAMSSCEGELIAASQSLVMGRTLRLLVSEFNGTLSKQLVPFEVKVDNEAAINQIKLGEHAPWRSRHISIRGTAVAIAKQTGELDVTYCNTGLMAADGLTKALTPQLLQRMKELWGLVGV